MLFNYFSEPQLFISYAHDDEKKAQAIASFLERQGIQTVLGSDYLKATMQKSR